MGGGTLPLTGGGREENVFVCLCPCECVWDVQSGLTLSGDTWTQGLFIRPCHTLTRAQELLALVVLARKSVFSSKASRDLRALSLAARLLPLPLCGCGLAV